MNRLLDSARTVGVALLVLPFVIGGALNLFPNYDARPEYFAASYPDIVNTGRAFPLSLVLLLLASLILGFLVIGLRRAPQAPESGGMLVVSGALGISAAGLAAAAVISIPVWVWADQVTDGVLTVSDGATKSQGLASTSQTLILLMGLGGLVVGLTTLGVLAYRFGWTPPLIFWVTSVVATAAIVAGFAMTLIWMALGLPPLLWTLMIGASLAVKGHYNTRT